MILVPFMPVFSRLTAPENWPELKVRIRQGLFLTALTMLPLTAIFMALAPVIIRVVYQRGAFKSADADLVIPVLMAYGIGMFFYLARDVLVRVFYALGDGETPFKVSIFNIFLNGFLDFLLYKPFQTPGLVFATIGVNVVSLVIFLGILNNRLGGLPLKEWGKALSALTGISFLAGVGSYGVSWGWEQYYTGNNLGLQLLQLFLSVATALTIFLLLSIQLKLPEVDILLSRIKAKLKR